jgi:hypothetical protein
MTKEESSSPGLFFFFISFIFLSSFPIYDIGNKDTRSSCCAMVKQKKSDDDIKVSDRQENYSRHYYYYFFKIRIMSRRTKFKKKTRTFIFKQNYKIKKREI